MSPRCSATGEGIPWTRSTRSPPGGSAYVNRRAGNSNYGIYVVLAHDEPALGEVYTLYAHLARVESGLHAGQPVEAGQVLQSVVLGPGERWTGAQRLG